ncbi:FMN-binding negative transcriptional regulator [Roseomonas marmotae]|uniref:FMN-binding negative transcriptional regulator n=1 Tax=Roseomonas marmotae TaxID=2768161 RepID=A0ABS3K8P3_9PROT|nr:FMN-binding negative transcriptional regulator [Roseomonas marmotae]MBO1073841.1 FMN-binding negative transcriptional regulator [Roseomonas marmotae]QTI78530.1 FMN-binding negative transcriptional regulator [Roseomonas marmotae]
MYLPPAFREDDTAAIHNVIRAARLAQLVTATAEGLMATPLPLLLEAGEGEQGVLYGHLARPNPQWKAPVLGEAMAIFMGPEAYVSPGWYAAKQEHGKVVPTWNYVAVHAYGPVEFFEEPERLLRIVTRLTEKHEAGRAEPWAVGDAPESFIRAHLRGIVGLRMPVTRLEGKRKMSQNRSEADRAGVAAGLAASQDPADRAVAPLIPR